MNIVFVWTGVTGYMGDCWRALAAVPGVRLKIWVEDDGRAVDARFDAGHELRGLDCTVVPGCGRDERRRIIRSAEAFRPDVFFLVGWRRRTPRFFAGCRAFRNVPKALVLDLPFRPTLRKLAARFVLARYLSRFSAAFVPGASASRYARWLGFGRGGRGLFTGLFSTNLRRFEGMAERKIEEGVPGRFLYVGRYAPEKDLRTLARAYRIYRERAEAPWPLDCVGAGPEGGLLEGLPGAADLGFRAPDELAGVYGSHGVFVLPSRRETWGVVLAEAAGAGLPIICTDACGARHELVRGNGVVCPAGDAEAMAGAMLRMGRAGRGELARMAREGAALAEPYSCEAWARRVTRISAELLGAK